jgi:hypothetical protein
MSFNTDIQIAREAKKHSIREIVVKLDIPFNDEGQIDGLF